MQVLIGDLSRIEQCAKDERLDRDWNKALR
jgi:hypothetical protein